MCSGSSWGPQRSTIWAEYILTAIPAVIQQRFLSYIPIQPMLPTYVSVQPMLPTHVLILIFKPFVFQLSVTQPHVLSYVPIQPMLPIYVPILIFKTFVFQLLVSCLWGLSTLHSLPGIHRPPLCSWPSSVSSVRIFIVPDSPWITSWMFFLTLSLPQQIWLLLRGLSFCSPLPLTQNAQIPSGFLPYSLVPSGWYFFLSLRQQAHPGPSSVSNTAPALHTHRHFPNPEKIN